MAVKGKFIIFNNYREKGKIYHLPQQIHENVNQKLSIMNLRNSNLSNKIIGKISENLNSQTRNYLDFRQSERK